MKNLVSVIIPIYNVEQYLEKCLDSVINQTYKDLEIICVNDCSSDNSLKILQEYSRFDNRIKIINFEQNKGVSAARNAGLEIAKGEYIGFVDGDDWIDLDFYEKLYGRAAETDSEIVKGNLIFYYADNSKSISPLNKLIQEQQSNLYFYTNFWTAIYKKTLLVENQIKFDEQFTLGEDVLFLNTSILAAKKQISVVDDVFYHYNRRNGSANSQFLDFEKIKSGVRAHELMILNILKTNINYSRESLTFIFTWNLKAVVNLYYKSMTDEAREYCIDKIISTYQLVSQYIQENTIDFSAEYISALRNADRNQLKKLVDKYNSKIKIISANLRALHKGKVKDNHADCKK